MESVLQNEKKCYVCYARDNLHSHHVFFGLLIASYLRKGDLKYGSAQDITICPTMEYTSISSWIGC